MKDLHHILDADPYQVAVLEDIKSGLNLVVEGPPGTGKSQTIANGIAELLAAGKRVLFVSEKMAALEVVKNRLDEAGLGGFCLELHSRKASKKDLLKELERSIVDRHANLPQPKADLDELESLRSELNDYVRALKEPIGKLGRSVFSLYQMKERALKEFSRHRRSMPRVLWQNVESYGPRDWTETTTSLKQLEELASLVAPTRANPWFGTMPGVVLPGDEEDILERVNHCLNAAEELQQKLEQLANTAGLRKPDAPRGMMQMLEAGSLLATGKPVGKNVLLNKEWDRPSEKARGLIQQISECQAQIARALTKLKAEALEENAPEYLIQCRNQHRKITRFFRPSWWRLYRKIRSLYRQSPPRRSQLFILDLEQLSAAAKKRTTVRAQSDVGKALFGTLWQQERSDVEALFAFSDWVVRFRVAVNEGVILEKAFDVVCTSGGGKFIEIDLNQAKSSFDSFLASRDTLAKRLKLDYSVAFGAQPDDIGLVMFVSRLKLLTDSIEGSQRWSQYVIGRQNALSAITSPLIELLESGQVEPSNLVSCFFGNFADNLLRVAFKERPSLARFIGDIHEKKISSFCDLDKMAIQENRLRLLASLYQNKPQIVGGASRGSEAGVLLGEFGRKRGHMPIRQLMIHCGRLIERLKPCFMMSPLSIAQFLDARSMSFDVILFDEASQVKPEDALGALLRGRQLVVMGDTRQLPPTTFFDSVVAGVEEDVSEPSEVTVAGVESILHQCRRSFPTKLLSWHYRSRHETLIAVSNHEFYDNRLLIFPSAIDESDTLGLKLVHLPGTVYDRGRSSVNRQEARAVAKAAIEHYHRFPNKSLGIGAFNIKQQQAILEEVELQLIENPDMEDLFRSERHEHFFVKNLETIQGDERDVIFISIGFGLDENGKLSLNFGPLNQAGGERRLNVLITRAREKCVLFSNFRAADLMLDHTSPFGLRALKTLLAFAEDRRIIAEELAPEEADSPFEDSVHDFLRDEGHEVRRQVGYASFRIDLAVVDPKSPGTYLAGIECDGQKYHTSPVARDRDRLRQQILENLGWRIVRIWSTDWYRNRKETQKRLLHSLRLLQSDPKVNNQNSSASSEEKPEERKDSGERDPFSDSGGEDFAPPKLLDLVPMYQVCSTLEMPPSAGELHRQLTNRLAKAVVRVVEVETPVHQDEVVRRIRVLWGLSRTGERIRDAIGTAISYALKQGWIRRKGKFLFTAAAQQIPVRKRGGDPPPDLDLVCDDEIIGALKLVLKYQYSTLIDDLVIQTCRVIGVRAAHESGKKRIERIVVGLIEDGQLEPLPNAMIRLRKEHL